MCHKTVHIYEPCEHRSIEHTTCSDTSSSHQFLYTEFTEPTGSNRIPCGRLCRAVGCYPHDRPHFRDGEVPGPYVEPQSYAELVNGSVPDVEEVEEEVKKEVKVGEAVEEAVRSHFHLGKRWESACRPLGVAGREAWKRPIRAGPSTTTLNGRRMDGNGQGSSREHGLQNGASSGLLNGFTNGARYGVQHSTQNAARNAVNPEISHESKGKGKRKADDAGNGTNGFFIPRERHHVNGQHGFLNGFTHNPQSAAGHYDMHHVIQNNAYHGAGYLQFHAQKGFQHSQDAQTYLSPHGAIRKIEYQHQVPSGVQNGRRNGTLHNYFQDFQESAQSQPHTTIPYDEWVSAQVTWNAFNELRIEEQDTYGPHIGTQHNQPNGNEKWGSPASNPHYLPLFSSASYASAFPPLPTPAYTTAPSSPPPSAQGPLLNGQHSFYPNANYPLPPPGLPDPYKTPHYASKAKPSHFASPSQCPPRNTPQHPLRPPTPEFTTTAERTAYYMELTTANRKFRHEEDERARWLEVVELPREPRVMRNAKGGCNGQGLEAGKGGRDGRVRGRGRGRGCGGVA